MLTTKQIDDNKKEFEGLIRSIGIKGADTEGLITWLEAGDFFYAPATTRYHGSYPGGLCEHSLNVYYVLRKLASEFAGKFAGATGYSEDTLKAVGLLHELGKVGYFETFSRNVKNDDTGKWEQRQEYRVRDPKDRDTIGGKTLNAFLAISRYIPLSAEEMAAIINQYAGMDKSENTEDLYSVLGKYPLVTLLHSADLISCYCIERQDE